MQNNNLHFKFSFKVQQSLKIFAILNKSLKITFFVFVCFARAEGVNIKDYINKFFCQSFEKCV